MNDEFFPFSAIWERLLSREAELVRNTFNELSPGEQQAVITHLRRMASEPGWHSEQRLSARSALEAING
jgi:hypothetical protein